MNYFKTPMILFVCAFVFAACGGADKYSDGVNRAPIADFEITTDGTTVMLVNADGINERSFDPDGDQLTFLWSIPSPDPLLPDLQTTSASTFITFQEPGVHTIYLYVTDVRDDPAEQITTLVFKDVYVNEDLIPGEVNAETQAVRNGRAYYEEYCQVCHGVDASSTLFPINVTRGGYDHSSARGVFLSLEEYISVFMPVGGVGECTGTTPSTNPEQSRCALDVAIYLRYLGGVAPPATPTPVPTVAPIPSLDLRIISKTNPGMDNLPSGSAAEIASLQEGVTVTVNVNGEQYVGIEAIPNDYPNVHSVEFTLSGAANLGPVQDSAAGYYINGDAGSFDRGAGQLPTGTYSLTVNVYQAETDLASTTTVNFNVIDDDGVNDPPDAIDSSTNTTGDAPLTVMFNGSNSTDDGMIIRYTWDFGDGSDPVAGTDSAVQYVYNTPGNYTAELEVLDDLGATDSVQIPITVRAVYDAAAVYGDNCSICHGQNGEGLGDIFPPLQGATFTRSALEAEVERMFGGDYAGYTCPQDVDCAAEIATFLFENFITEQ